jgi:hypothetical protein
VRVASLKPYGVTGEALDIKGRHSVTFELYGREYNHKFLVFSLPTDVAGLLGTDFLKEAGATLDFERSKMSLPDIDRAPHVHSDRSAERAALTVFAQGKEGHSPHPREQVAKQKGEQLKPNSNCEVSAPQNRVWLVKARENITLAPRCRQIIVGRMEGRMIKLFPLSCVCGTSPNSCRGNFSCSGTQSRRAERTPVFSGDDTK